MAFEREDEGGWSARLEVAPVPGCKHHRGMCAAILYVALCTAGPDSFHDESASTTLTQSCQSLYIATNCPPNLRIETFRNLTLDTL